SCSTPTRWATCRAAITSPRRTSNACAASRSRPKRCRCCLAPTKRLYSSWRGPTRPTFLRLLAGVATGGRIRSSKRTSREKSAPSRRRFDVDELTKSVSMGKPQVFDLAVAHELYVALFGPVETLIKDKPQLLIVPTGPLTALPFHLLVTDKPAIAVPRMQSN